MSVYLSEVDRARLGRLAEARGTSRSQVVRDALRALESAQQPDRNFAMAGVVADSGTSVRDMGEEELLQGFGDDHDGR